jgi:hypothetical protein
MYTVWSSHRRTQTDRETPFCANVCDTVAVTHILIGIHIADLVEEIVAFVLNDCEIYFVLTHKKWLFFASNDSPMRELHKVLTIRFY